MQEMERKLRIVGRGPYRARQMHLGARSQPNPWSLVLESRRRPEVRSRTRDAQCQGRTTTNVGL